jgi:hypothetical protein
MKGQNDKRSSILKYCTQISDEFIWQGQRFYLVLAPVNKLNYMVFNPYNRVDLSSKKLKNLDNNLFKHDTPLYLFPTIALSDAFSGTIGVLFIIAESGNL